MTVQADGGANGPEWVAGAVTGVGSLPGTQAREAARLVAGELPDLPHLAELPARGPGADTVGRATVFLPGLSVDLQPAGWRFVPRPGRDSGRTADLMERDLDEFSQALDGYTGPVKVQAAGPWTLAAGVELHRGDKALADSGACRDIAASLAEGLAEHVREVRRRVPGVTSVVVQLDEPSLPLVRAGRVPTSSGFGSLRAIEDPEVVDAVAVVRAAVVGAGGLPAVHCCAPGSPLVLLRSAGITVLGIDLAVLTERCEDSVGEVVDAGAHLLVGVVDPLSPVPSVTALLAPVRALWRRLGFSADLLRERVVLTPGCGLAGAAPEAVPQLLARLRESGQAVAEDPLGEA